MVNLCDSCKFLPSEAVRQFSNNDEEAFIFLRNHGVIPSEVTCPKCSKPCTLRSDRRTWKCHGKYRNPTTKERFQCNFTVTNYKGTFLENCHFEPWKIILYVNAWLQKNSSHLDFTGDLINFSSRTIVRWRKACSAITEYFADNQLPIGGPDIIVEIDVANFGNSRYADGNDILGMWMLAGIERISKRLFVVTLIENPYLDTATLIPLIQKYIRPGSIIISDEGAAYKELREYGYKHLVVNDNQTFLYTEEEEGIPVIHKQNIKRLWKDIKSYVVKIGIRKEYYKQYISRYVFIKSVPDPRELLHHFFIAAAQLYPHFGHTAVPGPSLTIPPVCPVFTPDSDSSYPLKHEDSDVEVSEEYEFNPCDSDPAIADACESSLQTESEHGTPVKKSRKCGGSTADQALSVMKNEPSSIHEEDPCEAFGRSIAASLRDLPREMNVRAQKLISDVISHAQIGSLDETSQIYTTQTGNVEYNPQIVYLTQDEPPSL